MIKRTRGQSRQRAHFMIVHNFAIKIFHPEWLNKIWRPDSYFKNAKRVTFQVINTWKRYSIFFYFRSGLSGFSTLEYMFQFFSECQLYGHHLEYHHISA